MLLEGRATPPNSCGCCFIRPEINLNISVSKFGDFHVGGANWNMILQSTSTLSVDCSFTCSMLFEENEVTIS